MRHLVGYSDIRRYLLVVCVVGLSAECFAQPDLIANELKSEVEEPKIHLPEFGQDSPFHAVSQSKVVSEDPVIAVVQESVNATRRRLLSAEQHTPWQIMHGLLALRQNFEIRKDGATISGIDWVSTGPTFDNTRWFEITRHGGRAQPYSRPYAFEGHANQFLAILSMSGLPLDHQFQTDQGPITMKDMLRHAQQTMNIKDEVTWSLWALSRYLPPDAQWMNEQGEPWSIERMVRIQTDAPLKGAPCGGTHGLFALAHARNVYLRSGQPLRGVWLEAEYKIRTHINTARTQQNSDGSLSSNYFRGRQYDQDFNKRMASAGHVLEFLMIALPQEQMQEQWVRQAVRATAADLLNNRKAYVKCSPLYHAVNGLSIYLDRVKPAQPPGSLAANTGETKTAQVDTLKSASSDADDLKNVPATRISSPKAFTENSDTKSSLTPGTAAAKTVKSGDVTGPVTPNAGVPKPAVEKAGPEATRPPNQPSPESKTDGESADSKITPSESGQADTAAEISPQWRTTLKSRRTPIALPEEVHSEAKPLLRIPGNLGI